MAALVIVKIFCLISHFVTHRDEGFKKFPLVIRMFLMQFNRNPIQSVLNNKDNHYLTKLEAQRQVGSNLQDPRSAS